MKLISYYDLLEMIKEKNIPKKVYWLNNRNEKISYIAEFEYGELNCYFLEERNKYNDDISYYLGENFLESTIFKKCIEIPNDDFENIEEIELGRISPNGEYVISVNDEKIQDKINSLIRNQRNIIEKLKDSDVN